MRLDASLADAFNACALLRQIERMLAGMLTVKPVRFEDVSDVVTEQLFDVDLQGNDLNVWTYETARK